MLLIRCLIVLAALTLGFTPAAAHGGFAAPGQGTHCMEPFAADAAAHRHDDSAGGERHGAPSLAGKVGSLCLCALVTTLAPAPVAPPAPPPGRPPLSTIVSVPDGLSPPPADRPPRS
jgi:hypothetical protein